MSNDIDVNNKLYLQVHRLKLQEFITKGLIAPDIYMGNNIETDLQSKNKQFLLLSNGYITNLDEYHVLIEVILRIEEKSRLHIVQDIAYLDTPIAISRIVKIYVKDKKTIKFISTNLDTGDAGYIPEQLFALFKGVNFKQYDYKVLEQNIHINEYNDKIIKYNSMLGMFAFMKNTNLYYTNKTGIFSNYSNNYFATLSKFNDIIIVKNETQHILNTIKDAKLSSLLSSNQIIDDTFINERLKECTDEDVKATFNSLLNEPSYKNKALDQLKDKGYYYYICLLYIHKQKNSNKKDNFKLNLYNQIPFDKAETALTILGAYYGYETIRAKEEIEIDDKYYKKLLAKNSINIKFKLDNNLDFITIETIYRYVFDNRKVTETLDYVTHMFKRQTIKLPTTKELKTFYNVTIEKYYDIEYIKIKKNSLYEVIIKKLDKYPDEITFGRFYLCSYISKYHKSLLYYSKDGKPCEPYFNKAKFLQLLENNIDSIKLKEILSVFELDKK